MKFKSGDILMHKQNDTIAEILLVLQFAELKGGGYLISFGDACYTIYFDFMEENYVKIGEV